jgi:hypothetical protein
MHPFLLLAASALPGHPLALMLSTVTADTTRHVCGIGAVREVGAAGCRQGGLKRCRPFLVGLGEAPDLVGGQTEIIQHAPERLTGVDRVQELLPQLGW